jgi:hypothetical protein
MSAVYRRLLWATTLLFFVCTLGTRALGTAFPLVDNPDLVGFFAGCDGQPQPCWYGIIPGKTTAEGTYNRLLRLGYEIDDAFFGNTRQITARLPDRADCGQITANIDQQIGVLYELYMHPCTLPLGEFLKAFGIPRVADVEFEPCRIRLLFVDGETQVSVDQTLQLTRYVNGFGLRSAETVQLDFNRHPTSLEWAGVLPLWRYKQHFLPAVACR